MNRIYKVIYSKARQCSIVVSEFAKSSHKNSRKGASHNGTPALARILAAALVAGAMTWGGVPEVSWAADNTTVTDSNGNTVTNTDTKIKDINANITGKGNKVIDSSNAEIVGDGNTVTNKMEGRWDTVRSNNVRIHGSGNFISGSRNQQVIGDNNNIIARDRGTVTDYQHPEGREENVSDLTIGRGNVIQSNDTYRNEWDSLKVIGNNNRADGKWDGDHAGGPSAGIVIGDNQNLNGIQDTIVIGSLAPSEQQKKTEHNGDLYTAGSNNIIIGYHTTTTQNGGIVIGNRSQGSGVFQTIMGPRSIIVSVTGNPDSGAGTMASIYGAFNKIEDAGSSNDSGLDIDGLGNSVNGSLNITSNARGTMIMGAGNTVTHAKGPDILGKDEDTAGATEYWLLSGLFGADYYGVGADTVAEGNNLNISYDEMRNAWQKYMETSGGAVSVLGNSNNADYAIRSQIIGTGNTLKGSETDMSVYNTVNGFANTGTNIKRTAIVGTGNTLTNSEDNVIIGDYHNLENGKHNVILGSMVSEEKQVTKKSKSVGAATDEHPDGTFEYTVTEQVPVKDHTKDIENAVMVGYNTDATVDGGVALGSDSVASTEAGIAGFDPQSRKHVNSEKDYSTWVSTDAAVSVGGADREVTYDVLDKDGKPVIDKATGKKKQETQIVKSTRQITNLAAGTEDTDAVNVAQLKSVNQKVAVVFDDKSSLMSTDATISHQILEDPGSFPEGEGQSIALGKNAHAYMQGGSKAQLMLFGMKKAAGAIAIGEGSEALSQSIDIGNRTYTGDMGDVTISKYGNGGSGSGVASVLLGTNSYTGGTLSTLIGDYSIMSTSYPNGNSAAYTQNAGAVSIGAFNSIESATSTNTTSGIANSIVGLANRTQNANGALIYGAGNEITNSIATASAPGYGSSAKAAANDLRQSVKSNPGGAALAIGGGNKIDKSIRTQTMGVNNEVTGSLYHEDATYEEFLGHKFESSPEVNEYSSQYNMVDGYNNKVSNTNNAYVIGTNNTILGKTFSADTKDGTLSKADRTKAKESDNLVIIGDNHTMDKDVKNNIVIGTSDKALTTSVSNAVLLGHNADVQNDGGVAVGDGSVAATDKGAVGYDLKGEDHSADTTGTWKSTAAAVSVGNKKKNLTRQITNVAAGTEDTDAVNVAQLKQVSDVINNNINANKVHYYSVKSKYQDDKSNYNNNGAKGQESIVLGIASSSDAGYSTVIGMGSSAKKRGTSQASGMYDTVVGQYLDTTGSYNSVFGTFYQNGSIQQLTKVYGDRNTVLGAGNIVGIGKNNTKVKSDENVVIGLNNSVEGSGSIIVGNATTVNGPATMNATSLGHVNHIYDQLDGGGQWGVALGNNLTVKGEYALAVGNNSTAQGDETVAVGYNANASVAGGAAIGSGSVASVDKGVEGYKPNSSVDTSTDPAGTWKSTDSAVSVGKADGSMTRQITGVAAGTNATDAVNVAQLRQAVAGAKDSNDTLKPNTDALKLDGNTLSMSVEDTAGHIVSGSVNLSQLAKAVDTNTTYTLTGEANPDNNTTTITLSDNSGNKNSVTVATKDTDTRNTVKAGENVTLDTKDNADGSHEYTVNVKADGKVEAGSTKIVSGDTVYNETRVKQDGTYVKVSNTAGENLSALDNQVTSNTQNINYLNGRVGELGDRINKVGAGAVALAALHPLDYDPEDKWDFAAGVGNYRNATAAAVGLFYRPNERTMFNLGWTMGDNRNMVNGGFSLKFGKSNKYIKYSKAEMASVIDKQSREIAELKARDVQNAKDKAEMKADNAEMKAEIEALKKQVEALAAKK